MCLSGCRRWVSVCNVVCGVGIVGYEVGGGDELVELVEGRKLYLVSEN